jgi:hypothetical protein
MNQPFLLDVLLFPPAFDSEGRSRPYQAKHQHAMHPNNPPDGQIRLEVRRELPFRLLKGKSNGCWGKVVTSSLRKSPLQADCQDRPQKIILITYCKNDATGDPSKSPPASRIPPSRRDLFYCFDKKSHNDKAGSGDLRERPMKLQNEESAFFGPPPAERAT